ncbi:carbohydrate kinase [Ruminococcus sp.]|uniref:carbohydrate kinase family protein n=1 Tax=Ruminococcus sp. TaxID=41978 RepID=UPI00386A7573
MFDVLTIGEMLIDLTQTGISDKGIPVYIAFPGGAPANVAVAAAKLGANTAFIGKVGNDAFGKLLVDTVKNNGVNADGMIVTDTANTTLAVVSLQENGERDFAFYRKGFADTQLSESEISDDTLKNTRILHFGSVSMTEDPSRTATFNSALRAKNMGATVTYDPNYRASLWGSLDDALVQMKMPLSIVDILKISDEELPLLADTDDPEQGTKLLSDLYGIPLILLTLGAKGAYYRFGDCTGLCEGVKVKVADTNGAGDTFFGAFLSGMAGLGKYKPSELSEDEIRELVTFANKAASITTSRSGAIPAMPTLDEVM